jgi:ribosome modulation factor
MENTPQTVAGDNGNKQTIIILLSILGGLCVILICVAVVAFYGINGIKKTQQADTATAQANATSTVVSRISQIAGYDFFDNFEDNHNQWRQGPEDNDYWFGNIDVRDGMYVWDVIGFRNSTYQSSWSSYQNSTPVEDFDLSVDARLFTPEANQMCYAVAFRADPDSLATNGYEFHVCDSQQFYVGYYGGLSGESKEILPWTQSNSIRSGEWNTLEVKARGDRFTLSINQEVVYEFTDSTSSSGRVYLMIRYYDQTPGMIQFDNFGLQPR